MPRNRSRQLIALCSFLAAGLATSAVAGAATKTTKKTTTKKVVTTTTKATATSAPTTAAPATTAAPTQSAAPACKGLTTVRMANFGMNSTTMMLDYAQVKGLFEKYCVKFERNTPIFNASLIVQSMDQGQADMSFVGTAGVLNAVAAKRDVVIVANASVGFPLEVDLSDNAAKRLAAHKVTADSPIATKLDWLKGLTFAAAPIGSTTDVVFRYLLKANGLNPDKDVTIRGIADNNAIAAAVKQDAVDGMVNVGNATTVQAIQEGWAKFFINAGAEEPTLKKMPLYVLVTSRSFLKAHPEAVEGVLRAMQESRQAMKDNKYTADDMSKIKAMVAPDMAQALWDGSTKLAKTHLAGGEMMPTQEEFKVMLDIYNATNATPLNVTFDQVYDTAIVSKLK